MGITERYEAENDVWQLENRKFISEINMSIDCYVLVIGILWNNNFFLWNHVVDLIPLNKVSQ